MILNKNVNAPYMHFLIFLHSCSISITSSYVCMAHGQPLTIIGRSLKPLSIIGRSLKPLSIIGRSLTLLPALRHQILARRPLRFAGHSCTARNKGLTLSASPAAARFAISKKRHRPMTMTEKSRLVSWMRPVIVCAPCTTCARLTTGLHGNSSPEATT